MTQQQNKILKSRPIQAILAAVIFGLGVGFVLAVGMLIFDKIARAYVSAGEFDIMLSYFQFFLTRTVPFGLLVFIVAEVGILMLKSVYRDLAPRIELFLRTAFAAGLLFLGIGYYFNVQSWYPKALSPRAFFYDLFIVVGCLILAAVYNTYRKKQLGKATKQLMKPVAVLVILTIFVNGASWFLKNQYDKEQPNVVFILIDALRSDHLGCYGYDKDTSPNIDALAEESLLFTESISQSTHTKPTMTSLYTSLYPSQHNVVHGNRTDAEGNFYSDMLDDSFKTMAEYLHEDGYNTAAFMDQGQLRGYMGFAQGYNYYNSYLGTAKTINQHFFRWLPRNEHRKFFAYLHYLDVHAPYTPSKESLARFNLEGKVNYVPSSGVKWEEAKENWLQFQFDIDEGKVQLSDEDLRELIALYDAGIRDVDQQIGLVFDRLKKEGLYDNSLIIVTSDHGDGFMEHNLLDHGVSLYEEVVRVPLIIKLPHSEKRSRIDLPVQTIDVLPTILDYLEIPASQPLMGQSVLKLKKPTNGDAGRPIICERGDFIALRRGNYKYIYDKATTSWELYNLETDPGEQNNIANTETELAQQMHDEVEKFTATFKATQTNSKGVKLDEETIEKLKTLGYIR